MARFSGEIGYAGETVEDPPGSGTYVEQITEFPYSGDVVRNSRRLESNDKVNDDISLSNSVSVVADEQALMHFTKIRYVRWMGVRWTVTLVEVKHPRLILNLGEVYNGPTPS